MIYYHLIPLTCVNFEIFLFVFLNNLLVQSIGIYNMFLLIYQLD